MRIVTVCAGNTCRSPMAAALLGRLLPEARVESAGVWARTGERAHPHAVAAAGAAGLDLSMHTARTLDAADLDSADCILAMTQALREAIVRAKPTLASRVLTLGEAAGDPTVDVPDPYGSDLAAYHALLDTLEGLCARAAERLRHPAPLGRVMAVYGMDAEGRSTVERRVRDWLRDAGVRVESVRVPSAWHGGRAVAHAVQQGRVAGGIAITDSGVEAAMAAARAGTRAVLGDDPVTVRLARGRFDVQVLSLGARVVGEDAAVELVRAFLRTPFAGGPEDLRPWQDTSLWEGHGSGSGSDGSDRMEDSDDGARTV